MPETKNKINTEPQTESRFPWGSSLLFVFLVVIFIFLFYNTSIFEFLKPKSNDLDWSVPQAEIRENRILLQKTLNELDDIKSELKDIRTNQGFILKKIENENTTIVIEEPSNTDLTLPQAVKELKYRIETVKPFTKVYTQLRKMLEDDHPAVLNPIEDYHKVGVPNADFLVNEFEDVAKVLLSEKDPEGSWWEKVVLLLKNLITVTKKGEYRPGLEGQIEELQNLVTKQNFEIAIVRSLDIRMNSKPKETWELHVQAYLDARRVLEALDVIVTNLETSDE